MDLRTLRAFVEVVRQGGFSQASKTIFATQSAVSKAVRQLEDELGAPLLDRIGHRTRLTALGELVYPRAVKLLTAREDLLADIAEMRGLKRGTLRLGLPLVASSSIFGPVVAGFRARYPGIEIRLTEHGGDELITMVRAGDIELAASLKPDAPDLEWQDVRREPLVAVLATDHPLAGASAVDIGALRETPFLLFGEGFSINRLVLAACRRHGFEPAVAARSSQVDFLLELARAGLGVAFLPRSLGEPARLSAGIAALMLAEPDTEWRLTMIWRTGAFLSHAARAWLAMLAQPPGEHSHEE